MSTHNAVVDVPGLEAVCEVLVGRRVVALAGAGCSTESGIPDYRGPDRKGGAPKPMQYGEFVGSAEARARYWSRSMVGWPRIRAARPNAAHRALARLERQGVLSGIITQNVDGLHHAAGSRRVIELHGSLAHVRCLDCGARSQRDGFQDRLVALNPDLAAGTPGAAGTGPAASAPDGDAHVPLAALAGFRVPACEGCGGVIKPDVVFFGENVPKARVAEAWRLFEDGEVLLIVGSSLTVYSGRRFSDRAHAEGRPIVIINLGPTRADEAAAIKVEGRLGPVLSRLADRLHRRPPRR